MPRYRVQGYVHVSGVEPLFSLLFFIPPAFFLTLFAPPFFPPYLFFFCLSHTSVLLPSNMTFHHSPSPYHVRARPDGRGSSGIESALTLAGRRITRTRTRMCEIKLRNAWDANFGLSLRKCEAFPAGKKKGGRNLESSGGSGPWIASSPRKHLLTLATHISAFALLPF